MDKYIGKRFDGRYEIQELIGVGGMAYVYKAYDTIDDRTVAVKILKEEFLSNEEFTRRFKNESKAIAILSHPNIVKVFDVSFSDDLQYIVMEFIDGITLKEYLKNQREMNWKETVHFTTQILRALQHAHDKGIVHRDVKPQNIMLLADGTIKMTDFGIARFSRSDIRFTMSPEKTIGSVHYISPEQARGDLTDEKADIYSVGVMMYEMLTKRLPFDGDNAVSIAIMQMQSEPVSPSKINKDIPEGLEEITLKAMQKDCDKRYQSAAEMLYDIDEFKRNPSIHFAYKYFVDDTPTKFVETAPLALEEDTEEVSVKKGPPVIPILAAISAAFVLVVVVVLVLMFALGGGSGKTTVEDFTVDNFINKVYEEVITDSKYTENYEFIKIDMVGTDLDEGKILSQSIAPGRKEKKPSNGKIRITLTVSSGVEKVFVPKLTEEDTAETAKTKLNSASLVFTSVPRSSDTVPVGKVISTNPPAETQVKKGSEVKVYISTGQEKDEINVPNVVNSHKEEAVNKLKGSGLDVPDNAFTYKNNEFGSAKKEGIVLEQKPAADAVVERYSEASLVLSTGLTNAVINIPIPENATAPVDLHILINGKEDNSLRGQNMYYPAYKEYTIAINDRDLRSYEVVVKIKETASPAPSRDYIKYTVNGEEGVATQSDLTPYVPPTETTTTPKPTEREMATVPYFTGDYTESSVIQGLRFAGLTAVIDYVSSESVPAGRFVSCIPGVGERVAKDSEVLVYISSGPAADGEE